MTNYEKYRDEIIKATSESANFCSDFVVPKTLKTMKYDCDDISCDTVTLYSRCGSWMNIKNQR